MPPFPFYTKSHLYYYRCHFRSRLHMHENTWHVSFSGCLISISMMTFSSIYFLPMTSFHFFLYSWVTLHCVYIPHFLIHSSVFVHLGWFHSLTTVNSATINKDVQVISCMLIYTPLDICPSVVYKVIMYVYFKFFDEP
jgi:hypothetical protein